MTQEERLKRIATIKKCLEMSKRASSNENEAATALRQAQALMEKYEIDHQDVLAAEAAEASVKTTVSEKPSAWEAALVGIVCAAFGCDSVLSWRRWIIVGVGPKAEIAGYAVTVLLRRIKAARAEYIQEKLKRCAKANKTKRADEFCIGWVMAVRKNVRVFARCEEDSAIIQAYKDQRFGRMDSVVPIRREFKRDYGDGYNGHRAGRDVTLQHGMPGLGGEQGRIGHG